MWDWEDFFGGGDPDFSEIPQTPPFEMQPADPMGPGFDPGTDPSMGNPFLPPGGGQENGPDTPSGPGGDETGSGGPQFDWSAFKLDPQGYLSKVLSAGGIKPGSGAGGIGDVLKMLGLGNGGMASLLPLLLAGGGAFNANNATNKASQQLQDAAKQANQQATDLIGGARSDFQPYMQAGQAALPQLQAMVGNNNMAGLFGPVASQGFAKPGSVASHAFSPIKGAMTLADLAKRK